VKTFGNIYHTSHGNEITNELTRGRGVFCSQVCWTAASLGDLKAEYK